MNIPKLFLIIFIGASCAPKYGAHFQPSKNDHRVVITDNQVIQHEEIEDVNTEVTVEPETEWLEVTASSETVAANPLTPVIERHNSRVEALEKTNLTPVEKEKEAIKSQKILRKEIKREIKEARAKDDQYVLMMILGILIAPLGVGLTYGIGPEFWISLVLFLLFWLPGAIYGGIKVHQFFRG